jgi:hypothetical protein
LRPAAETLLASDRGVTAAVWEDVLRQLRDGGELQALRGVGA